MCAGLVQLRADGGWGVLSEWVRLWGELHGGGERGGGCGEGGGEWGGEGEEGGVGGWGCGGGSWDGGALVVRFEGRERGGEEKSVGLI